MTIEEFGRTIKQKYPQYNSYSDKEIGERMLSKYPVYRSRITEQTQTVLPKKEGFLKSYGKEVVGEYKKAGEEVIESYKRLSEGKQGILSTALQTVGQVAKATFAPFTPAIEKGFTGITSKIAEIPTVQKFATNKTVSKGLDKIESGVEKIEKWAEENPTEARNVEAAVNIAALFGGKAGSKTTGKGLTGLGSKIEKSGLQSLEKKTTSFADDLVRPVKTKAVKEAEVARTSEKGLGIFKRSEIEATPLEAKAAEEVAKVPGVSKSKTYQQNYNIIRDYNKELAVKLEENIAANEFLISKKEIISRLNKAKSELADSPLIVGDAEKTANKLLNGALKIVNEQPGTGSGVLKARKLYDKWVKTQKPKAFDAKAENAFTTANRKVRDTLNDILDEKATSINVKQSLKQQRSLNYALENIVPKAAQEADTAFGRALQRVGQTLGTKNKIVQGIAAAVGIGGLGAAATFAPAAAVALGTGFVILKGGQLILKPQLRILFGRLLKQSGHLLGAEEKSQIQMLLEKY